MLGVDVGGTFTDVVAVRDGRIITTKVPTLRTDTERSVLEGARSIKTGLSPLRRSNCASVSPATPAPTTSTRNRSSRCASN